MIISKKKVVVALVDEFHNVPVQKKGRRQKRRVVVASVDEFHIVPVKKEGRRSLGRQDSKLKKKILFIQAWAISF